MAVESLKKRTARIQLDDGTDGQGNQRYVYDNVSYISKDGWDADKFLAFATAAGPCLSKEITGLETIATSSVSAS